MSSVSSALSQLVPRMRSMPGARDGLLVGNDRQHLEGSP
jgi:hypothetical protein